MALMTGELSYSTSNIASSDAVAVVGDGELHVVYDAERCYSAWIEIYHANDVLFQRIPFILTNKPNVRPPSIHVANGQKVKVCASVNPAVSRLKYQVFHVAHVAV